MTQEELEKLILENQASLARVETTVLKIKKKIFWQELAGLLKLVLILGPLLLGLVYLTPYLKQYGNMSSPTVMFVLNDIMNDPTKRGPGCGMAFGPGLTLESFAYSIN